MIVPELPAEIRELKERVARFVEQEVYPLEERIAERGSIDSGRARRAAPRGAGGRLRDAEHAARARRASASRCSARSRLEEESGKATNGLGFAVVDRGPRELLELVTPEQAERFVDPIVRGDYREAWALTEPGAGSDLSGLTTSATRDGDDWLLNGEKWFVTSEGDPGVYIVAAVADGEQLLFLVEPDAPGLEIVRTPHFLHDPVPRRPSRDPVPRLPGARREPDPGERGRRREGVDPRRAPLHRGALLRRGHPPARPRERVGAGA